MQVHAYLKLTTRHLQALEARLGFKPDRATVRQWCKEIVYQQLETPADRVARTEPRPLLEAGDNGDARDAIGAGVLQNGTMPERMRS
jgi:hypothetical protein